MKTIIPYQVIGAFKTMPVAPDIFLPIEEGGFPRMHRKLDVVFSVAPEFTESKPLAWLLTESRQQIHNDSHGARSYTLYTDLLEAVEDFKASPRI